MLVTVLWFCRNDGRGKGKHRDIECNRLYGVKAYDSEEKGSKNALTLLAWDKVSPFHYVTRNECYRCNPPLVPRMIGGVIQQVREAF